MPRSVSGRAQAEVAGYSSGEESSWELRSRWFGWPFI